MDYEDCNDLLKTKNSKQESISASDCSKGSPETEIDGTDNHSGEGDSDDGIARPPLPPPDDFLRINRCIEAYAIAEFCGLIEMKKQAAERFRLLAPAVKDLFMITQFAEMACMSSPPSDRGLRDILCSILKSRLEEVFGEACGDLLNEANDPKPEFSYEAKNAQKLLTEHGELALELLRMNHKAKKEADAENQNLKATIASLEAENARLEACVAEERFYMVRLRKEIYAHKSCSACNKDFNLLLNGPHGENWCCRKCQNPHGWRLPDEEYKSGEPYGGYRYGEGQDGFYGDYQHFVRYWGHFDSYIPGGYGPDDEWLPGDDDPSDDWLARFDNQMEDEERE